MLQKDRLLFLLQFNSGLHLLLLLLFLLIVLYEFEPNKNVPCRCDIFLDYQKHPRPHLCLYLLLSLQLLLLSRKNTFSQHSLEYKSQPLLHFYKQIISLNIEIFNTIASVLPKRHLLIITVCHHLTMLTSFFLWKQLSILQEVFLKR